MILEANFVTRPSDCFKIKINYSTEDLKNEFIKKNCLNHVKSTKMLTRTSFCNKIKMCTQIVLKKFPICFIKMMGQFKKSV